MIIIYSYIIFRAFLATLCVHVSVHFHISYHIHISCLFHMAFQILVRLDYIIQSDHLNSSYGIFMPTSRFTDFTEEQFVILIFQCLVSIFDTGSLCSFKYKVLRVHLQLESPKSEHRNSSYVRNNPDYSMIQN